MQITFNSLTRRHFLREGYLSQKVSYSSGLEYSVQRHPKPTADLYLVSECFLPHPALSFNTSSFHQVLFFHRPSNEAWQNPWSGHTYSTLNPWALVNTWNCLKLPVKSKWCRVHLKFERSSKCLRSTERTRGKFNMGSETNPVLKEWNNHLWKI